jgi:hypothetical protein
MAHRLSIVVAVLVALVGAFLFVRTSDEALPAGARSILVIWDHGDVAKVDTIETLARSAAEHDIGLVKDALAASDGGAVRTLYVVHKPVGHAWPDEHRPYPDVGRDLVTRWADIATLPVAQTNGMYDSDAPEERLALVADDLEALGMQVSTQTSGPLTMVPWAFYVIPMVPLVLAALLAVVSGVGHAAVIHRRRDAILHVSGRSRRSTTARTVRDDAVLVVSALALGLLVSLPVLAWYDGLAQWPRVALVSALAVAGVLVVVVGSVAVAALIRARARLLPAIRGVRPTASHALGLAVVHAVVLGLVVSVVSTGVDATARVSENRADRAAWAAADEWFLLRFHSGLDEALGSDEPFAAIARTELARHEALLAVQPNGPFEGYGPDHGASLTVNRQYLRHHAVDDASGRRFGEGDVDPSSLILLIPEALADQSTSIAAEWRAWLDWESSDHEESPPRQDPVGLEVRFVADGQSLFTYGTTWGGESSHQRDAVVAVLPTDVDVVSDNWLASNMTSGGVLFSDPVSVQRQLDASGLDQQIGSIERAADIAGIRIAEQSRELRDIVAVTVLGVVALVLSAVMTAAAVAERGRRRDVVLVTAGAGPLRTAILPATVTAAAGAVVVAVTRGLGLIDGPGPLGAAAGVVVVDVVVTSAVLALHRSRIRADTLNRA